MQYDCKKRVIQWRVDSRRCLRIHLKSRVDDNDYDDDDDDNDDEV